MSCLRQLRCLQEAIQKKLDVQAEVYQTTENNKESEEERKVRETKIILSRAIGVRCLKQTEIDQLKKELAELQPFLSLKLEEVTKNAEPVFMSEHFCNSNLTKEGIVLKHPKTKANVKISTQLEMIKFNDLSVRSLEKLNKDFEESKEQINLR